MKFEVSWPRESRDEYEGHYLHSTMMINYVHYFFVQSIRTLSKKVDQAPPSSDVGDEKAMTNERHQMVKTERQQLTPLSRNDSQLCPEHGPDFSTDKAAMIIDTLELPALVLIEVARHASTES